MQQIEFLQSEAPSEMWSPVPLIDAWQGETRKGATPITLSTGDGRQRKLSQFQVTDDRKVEELTP